MTLFQWVDPEGGFRGIALVIYSSKRCPACVCKYIGNPSASDQVSGPDFVSSIAFILNGMVSDCLISGFGISRSSYPQGFPLHMVVFWGMMDIMNQGVIVKDIARMYMFIDKILTLNLLAGPIPKSGQSFNPMILASCVTGDPSSSDLPDVALSCLDHLCHLMTRG